MGVLIFAACMYIAWWFAKEPDRDFGIIDGITKGMYNGTKSLFGREGKVPSLFKKPSTDHGASQWLKGRGLSNLLNHRNKGVAADGDKQLDLEASYKNVLVVAPTGSGKTTRFVQPSVYRLAESDCSLFLVDTSSEIYSNSHKYLRSKGFEVKVLALDQSKAGITHRFNPLLAMKDASDARGMAELLVGAKFKETAAQDQFWMNGATQLIALILTAMLKAKPSVRNLHNLNRLVNMAASPKREVLDRIMARDLDQSAFESYVAFVSQEEKIVSSMISSAQSVLMDMYEPHLQWVTASESIHLKKCREKKMAVFLIVEEHKIESYGFLLSLFWYQCFDHLMKMPQSHQSYLPVFALLDEGGNVFVPELPRFITTLRKRKVSISLILQDTQQLDHLYHGQARTIVSGGCNTRLVYAGVSGEQAEELSRLLGQKTILTRPEGKGWWLDSKKHEMGIPLLRPEAIRTLKANEAILIHGSLQPALIKTVPYYRHPKFKSLGKQ
jgi:type IV secretion system protein VirD4